VRVAKPLRDRSQNVGRPAFHGVGVDNHQLPSKLPDPRLQKRIILVKRES
jgi:hypothetical protein